MLRVPRKRGFENTVGPKSQLSGLRTIWEEAETAAHFSRAHHASLGDEGAPNGGNRRAHLPGTIQERTGAGRDGTPDTDNGDQVEAGLHQESREVQPAVGNPAICWTDRRQTKLTPYVTERWRLNQGKYIPVPTKHAGLQNHMVKWTCRREVLPERLGRGAGTGAPDA